ncbi:MAG: polyhydroxybutyrate depolymerase [Saprospiraceae bacterium]|jgi:polyhydroxybutyrate depolymerase
MKRNLLVITSIVLFLLSFMVSYGQDYTLTWDGLTRYYRVHVPSTYSSSTPTPVIIVMHGGFGSGTQIETQSQLSIKADQEGFIVVYPDGVKSGLGIRTWNADGCCGYAQTNNIDDVGFINNLLDTIINKYNIDTDKIYASGMSNGAFMSYRLACELSTRFAAIASVSGTMNVQNCLPTRQVPVIHFHSYLDGSVPYLGGIGSGPSNHYNPPIDSVLNVWKSKNSCTVVDTVQNDSDLLHVVWSSCQCDNKLELYLTHDGGHSWHGGQKTATGNDVSNMVSANDKMWSFFQANPLCPVSTNEHSDKQVTVTPNPFSNNFKVHLKTGTVAQKYYLYNTLGKIETMRNLSNKANKFQISTQYLPIGLYYLIVQSDTGLLTIKVVKN